MADDPYLKACALLGAIVSLEILGALVKNGALKRSEAREIVDRRLVNLEMRVQGAPADLTAAIGVARQICEAALSELQGEGPLSRT